MEKSREHRYDIFLRVSIHTNRYRTYILLARYSFIFLFLYRCLPLRQIKFNNRSTTNNSDAEKEEEEEKPKHFVNKRIDLCNNNFKRSVIYLGETIAISDRKIYNINEEVDDESSIIDSAKKKRGILSDQQIVRLPSSL